MRFSALGVPGPVLVEIEQLGDEAWFVRPQLLRAGVCRQPDCRDAIPAVEHLREPSRGTVRGMHFQAHTAGRRNSSVVPMADPRRRHRFARRFNDVLDSQHVTSAGEPAALSLRPASRAVRLSIARTYRRSLLVSERTGRLARRRSAEQRSTVFSRAERDRCCESKRRMKRRANR